MPAIRALARAGSLTLAVPAPLRPLVEWARLADRLLPVAPAVDDPPECLPPPGDEVDVAVNLHGLGPQSTEALRRLRPRRLWAYGIPGAPPWDPEEHEVRRWCRLVEHHGCATDPAELFLAAPCADRAGVLIHPGAGSADRRWPAERFATVAGRLAADGQTVRVSGGPGERSLATAVVRGAGHPAVTLAAELELRGLVELVRRSELVICGDTGVAHLATALRTASIVLFGPQPPSRWGPPPLPRHRVLWSPDSAQAGPSGPHPALLRIRPADVLDAARRLL